MISLLAGLSKLGTAITSKCDVTPQDSFKKLMGNVLLSIYAGNNLGGEMKFLYSNYSICGGSI